MCPPGYQHNGFVATHALGHIMYAYTLLVPMNQRVLNKLSKELIYPYYIYIYIHIYIHIYIYNIYACMTSKNDKVMHHLYSYFHNLITTVDSRG